MRQFVSISRVRSVIAGAHSEKEAAEALRRHRIRYCFSTDGGIFHVKIPTRSGSVLIFRTASRSAPLSVVQAQAARPGYPFPVPLYSWND